MNCTEIVVLLPEYVRRRLLPDQEATVRAHLSACDACAAAYEDELAFGSLAHATDAPVPPQMLAQVMASVRAEPRQAPAFRLRPLDVVVAVAIATALAGVAFGLLSLQRISSVLTSMFDPAALLNDPTTRTIAFAILWGAIALVCSLPLAAGVYVAYTRSRRPSVW